MDAYPGSPAVNVFALPRVAELSIAQRPFMQRLLLVVVGCIVFGLNLGGTRLWDVDEAIFSEAAVEMMERGDWVTPYYNGHLFAHKPPLMYWCQIAAFHVFGQTEFAARLFSSLFCVGTLLLTYEIGSTLFNRRTGFWGGLILSGCIQFAVIARAATPDAHLTFFSTAALLILIRGTSRWPVARTADHSPWEPVLPPSWLAYAFSYAVMAAGTLVKGPVAIVVPMAVWGMFLLLEQPLEWRSQSAKFPTGTVHDAGRGQSRCRTAWNTICRFASLFRPDYFLQTVWRMRPLTAIVVLAIVAGPWYAMVGWRTHGEFLHEFFLVQNVGRAAHSMEGHYGPIYYYVVAVCIGTFPWGVLLWPAIGHVYCSIRDRVPARAGYVLLVCWAAVWIGCFSIVATKLASYVIPAYPALALCIAGLVDAWLTKQRQADFGRWLQRAWLTFAAAGIACLIAVPIATHILLAGEWTPALIGLVPLTGAVVGWRLKTSAGPHGGLITVAVTSLVFCTALLGFAALPIDGHKNTHTLGDVIHANMKGPAHIATYKYSPPSFVFYSGLFFDRLRNRDAVAAHFRHYPQDAFLVTTASQVAELSPQLPRDCVVLKTERMFLKHEKVVVLGRRPVSDVVARPASPKTFHIPAAVAN